MTWALSSGPVLNMTFAPQRMQVETVSGVREDVVRTDMWGWGNQCPWT